MNDTDYIAMRLNEGIDTIDDLIHKTLNEGANKRNVERAVKSFFDALDSGADEQTLKQEIEWVVSELKLQARIK
jgi:hypothetical protein